jgi:HEAT repeat protein
MVNFIIFPNVDISIMSQEREIPELINSLATDYNRFEAADALISKGAKSVEPLMAALKLDNWKIRGNAAWTLGKIGDHRAVKPLIDALGDEVPEVRATAGQALLNIGTPAIGPLVESLNSAKLKNKGLVSCLLTALHGEPDEAGAGSMRKALKPI